MSQGKLFSSLRVDVTLSDKVTAGSSDAVVITNSSFTS